MARPAKKRLKVYRTTIGFFESVVAAANQRDALNAWGVHQNLFSDGGARVEDDAEAIEAALAAPGQLLRRPTGSKAAYAIEPEMPKAPSPPGRQARIAKAKKPDRRDLDRAEAALKAVNERHATEAKALHARRSKLEADEASAESRWKNERETAKAALDAARDAFRRASTRSTPNG